jgi:hypothetical protein
VKLGGKNACCLLLLSTIISLTGQAHSLFGWLTASGVAADSHYAYRESVMAADFSCFSLVEIQNLFAF